MLVMIAAPTLMALNCQKVPSLSQDETVDYGLVGTGVIGDHCLLTSIRTVVVARMLVTRCCRM